MSRHALFWTNLLWKIATAFAVLSSIFAIYQNGQINERQTSAIRSVLCLADRQVQTSKQRTQEEKDAAHAFYVEALRLVHADPCEPIPGLPKER